MSGSVLSKRTHPFLATHHEAFEWRWLPTLACRSVCCTLQELDAAAIVPRFRASVMTLAGASWVMSRDGKTSRGSFGRFENRHEQPAGYYLAICGHSVELLSHAIRQHGGIESRLHHVQDVSFREDVSRIRHNSGIFAQLHRFALNLLCHNGQTNIHASRYGNALSLDRLLSYKAI